MTKEEAIALAEEEVFEWGFDIDEDRVECKEGRVIVYTKYRPVVGIKAPITHIKKMGWENGTEVFAKKGMHRTRSFRKEFKNE
jgi:hypothetical protein